MSWGRGDGGGRIVEKKESKVDSLSRLGEGSVASQHIQLGASGRKEL